MSVKSLDRYERWRSKTVSFRVSPEEAEQLDILSNISGLTKQDYLINRVLAKEITVIGNPRVYKALRNQLADILIELQRLNNINSSNHELLELIRFITEVLNGLANPAS